LSFSLLSDNGPAEHFLTVTDHVCSATMCVMAGARSVVAYWRVSTAASQHITRNNICAHWPAFSSNVSGLDCSSRGFTGTVCALTSVLRCKRRFYGF